MVVNINICFICFFFLISMIGCNYSKRENLDEQLYLVHIGESDKPIEDILIYIDKSIIRSDIDSTFVVKFKIPVSDFDGLRRYVVENNTGKLECEKCNRGSFEVVYSSSRNPLIYVVEREIAKRYFTGLSTLARSNIDLQEFIENNIIEQL